MGSRAPGLGDGTTGHRTRAGGSLFSWLHSYTDCCLLSCVESGGGWFCEEKPSLVLLVLTFAQRTQSSR